MIPYEELCATLAAWRARKGLPTGPSDYLGEPVDHALTPLPVAAADDEVELADDAAILDSEDAPLYDEPEPTSVAHLDAYQEPDTDDGLGALEGEATAQGHLDDLRRR